MDIEQFIKNGIRPRMNNCMTRMISGLCPPYEKCHDSMVDQAIENITKDYAFIGFVSRLSASVDLLTDRMQWQPIEIGKENSTKNRPDIGSMPEKTLDLIRQYNSLDIKLYDILCKESSVCHELY